jgi:hypothetical protein
MRPARSAGAVGRVGWPRRRRPAQRRPDHRLRWLPGQQLRGPRGGDRLQQPGDGVTLGVQRGGRSLSLRATLARQPQQAPSG